MRDEIEVKYLISLIREVAQENKLVYEHNLQDMLRKQDNSPLHQICTRLMMKSTPGIKEEDLIAMVRVDKMQFDTVRDIDKNMQFVFEDNYSNTGQNKKEQQNIKSRLHDKIANNLELVGLKRQKVESEHNHRFQNQSHGNKRVAKLSQKENMYNSSSSNHCENPLYGDKRQKKVADESISGNSFSKEHPDHHHQSIANRSTDQSSVSGDEKSSNSGTYYINNITNNIIVDKKRQQQQ